MERKTNEESLAMLVHFRGQFIYKLEYYLEAGLEEKAERARLELIVELKGLEETPEVKGNIEYLKSTKFSSLQDLEKYREFMNNK